MNVVMVVRGRLFRGQRPRTDEDYARLKGMGIEWTLSLESGWLERLTGTTNRDTCMAVRHELLPIHLPISPFLWPSDDTLRTALTILASYPLMGIQGSPCMPVYVHCKDGVDRTGIVCAAYRVLMLGWSVDDAIKEMYGLGYHRWRYWHWIHKLKNFIANHHMEVQT